MAVNITDKNSSFLSCVKWGQDFEIIHTEALKTSYLWACIINGFLAIHTTILNSLIIVLYFKDRRLQTTANVLILALAGSDLFTALLAQPAGIVNNALKLNEIHSCISELVAFNLNEFGLGLSCITVCFTITFERLLAVRWPLKHRVLVTKSRLKKIFLAQAFFCVFALTPVPSVSLKYLLAIQSGFIISMTIFMSVGYLCIFAAVHKRSQTVARNCLAAGSLEKGCQNPMREKTAAENVSQDSKRKCNSGNNVSQNSDIQNERPENVPLDSKRISLKIVSHGSIEMKVPDEKLKDEQSSMFNARAFLQKAMLKTKQESRVCKTMSMVAGALVLCFVPRAVIFLYVVSGVISMQTFYNYLAAWIDVLAFLNSSLNPYIYFFQNKDIMDGVRKLVFGKSGSQLNRASLPPEANRNMK